MDTRKFTLKNFEKWLNKQKLSRRFYFDDGTTCPFGRFLLYLYGSKEIAECFYDTHINISYNNAMTPFPSFALAICHAIRETLPINGYVSVKKVKEIVAAYKKYDKLTKKQKADLVLFNSFKYTELYERTGEESATI